MYSFFTVNGAPALGGRWMREGRYHRASQKQQCCWLPRAGVPTWQRTSTSPLPPPSRQPATSRFFWSGPRTHHHSDLHHGWQAEQQQALLHVVRGCESSSLLLNHTKREVKDTQIVQNLFSLPSPHTNMPWNCDQKNRIHQVLQFKDP